MDIVYFGLVPLQLNTAPDLRVLGFTITLALLSGLLFGLAPVRSILRADVAVALRRTSRTVRGEARPFGKLLVSSQTLTGAGVRSRSICTESRKDLVD